MLYKSHVLSFIEYRTAGIHFASTSVLNSVDDVQSRFVSQVGLDETNAFMLFNLAPLCVRRDIAMLGVIHRAVLLQGPAQLWKFFRRDVVRRREQRSFTRHSLQLIEWPPGRDLEIMRRSALGMIRVYNLLPQEAVAAAHTLRKCPSAHTLRKQAAKLDAVGDRCNEDQTGQRPAPLRQMRFRSLQRVLQFEDAEAINEGREQGQARALQEEGWRRHQSIWVRFSRGVFPMLRLLRFPSEVRRKRYHRVDA